MPNVDLLRETLQCIKENPDSYDQRYFVNPCSTKFCFAGHAAMLAGAEVPTTQPWFVNDDGKLVHRWHLGSMYIDMFAEKKLGLSGGQADALFSPSNSLEDVERMVAEIIDDPDVDYNDLMEDED